MGRLQKRLFAKIARLRKLKKALKGSSRDPFLYLGLVSAILLVLVPLVSKPSSNLLANPGGLSLAAISQSLQMPREENSSLDSKNGFSPEAPELLLVEKSSLKSGLPLVTFSPRTLGVLVGGIEAEEDRKAVIEYVAESGDSLAAIAEKFNISLESLLWANNLSKNSRVKVGQTFIIPPVSGLIYHVKSGDTISDIAKRHKADASEIVSFNNLSGEADIFVGDILIVPNGVMPAPVQKYVAPVLPLPNSYFICPIASPCQLTQGLHWFNAVDFSNGRCGGPVYAAAAGQVLRVKLTNSFSRSAFGGAGNNLSILHPNGVVTSYSHLLTSLVQPGDQVSQGQIIALIGGQPGTPGAGRSTGCHLHFGVVGSGNPFVK